MFKKRAKRAFDYDYICPECGHKSNIVTTETIIKGFIFKKTEYWHWYNCRRCNCNWLIINKNKEAKVYDN